ncbi:MAG TPA: ribonuclease M5 [Cerasibacillus sp.]|uniref:ribonuclease M5 n=1 Tax=Cerasibacillus sp. TaxID=2498711 RepID=UPI002F40584F
MQLKEIIVVEGKDDTVKVNQAVQADTIETNGSAINDAILEAIRHAQEKRGVIIFTDPDYPGKRIRHIIDQAVPGCKHAFLSREQAQAKHPKNKSLGIEHASIEDIQEALRHVYELTETNTPIFDQQDLLEYGLIGGKGANKRRKRLGEILKIGHVNGKQLLKRLSMFQITKAEVEQALRDIEREEKADAE